MNLENQPSLKQVEVPQERNLALERQEAVKLHNALLKERENFSEKDKQWNNEERDFNNPRYGENESNMNKLRRDVNTIDNYKKIAIPEKEIPFPKVGDISNVEKIKEEKQKIDIQIEKTKKDIVSTTNTLNDLRKTLGMPPSEDIPSLIQKKEGLQNLLVIKDELENKLSFEQKKAELQREVNNEDKKREGMTLHNSLEVLNSDIGKLGNLLEDRKKMGYSQILQDEESFTGIASQYPDVTNFEEMKNYFSDIESVIKNTTDKWQLNDNPESLYSVSRLSKQLASSIREYTSHIQNEEERGEVLKSASTAAERLDNLSSLVATKAQAIADYQNVRLP
ncbi:MAG: hypothetical protein KBC98_01785 [Candidatus Pacebacteria bacterium]|nr:hypothetical protein [Candidatus Paceibacterota bacterium]